ncbi:MAG: TonB-dependent receptor [candidate division WOR-3 bacterium]|nr:TonB-dependent receptor [candidate division WOR-3 bacterium]
MNLFLYCLFAVSISGRVFNIDTSEPLPAHIYLLELDRTFVCDSTGKFLIEDLRPDNYTIIASHIGFKEDTVSVDLKNFEHFSISIGLQIIPIPLEPVKVIEKKPFDSRIQISSGDEIQIIPGAIKDVFRAIQTLPGVSTPSDYLGLIYVRGGELYENLVYNDNLEIIAPYHYFGIGSAFNTDLIKEFELYDGVLPARYGDAISSVLSIKSKKPEGAISGSLGIDLLEAKYLYICPVNDYFSFVFSSKRNYLDVLLKNIGIVKDVLLPFYVDHQGRILISSPFGEFSISGLKSSEGMNIVSSFTEETLELKLDGSQNALGTDWNWGITNNTTISISTFYSDMNRELYGAIPQFENARTNEKIVKKKYCLNCATQSDFKILRFEAGGGYGKFKFLHQGQKIEDLLYGLKLFDYSLEVDTSDNYKFIYFSERFYTLKPLLCELGQRIDWSPLIKNPYFSPRIGFIYERNPRLYAGYGHHFQTPPFEYELQKPEPIYAKVLNLGLEYFFKEHYAAKLEYYQKIYHNLVKMGTAWFDNRGTGFASGFELFVKKYQNSGNFYWISYGFLSSNRPSPYDTENPEENYGEHKFNFLIYRKITKSLGVSLRVNLATGNYYYEVIGRKWQNERWMPVYAPERAKLPAYQRIDIEMQRQFYLWGFSGEFYIAILNLTNQRNIQGYLYNNDWTMRKAFYMMPRLPLLGLRLRF